MTGTYLLAVNKLVDNFCCYENKSLKFTLILAASLGLPTRLKMVAEVLKLPLRKMEQGKELMKFLHT